MFLERLMLQENLCESLAMVFKILKRAAHKDERPVQLEKWP